MRSVARCAHPVSYVEGSAALTAGAGCWEAIGSWREGGVGSIIGEDGDNVDPESG